MSGCEIEGFGQEKGKLILFQISDSRDRQNTVDD